MAPEHNIAYANMRWGNVANETRDRMNKKRKCNVGEISSAREWIRQPGVNKNIRYRIAEIGHDKLGA